VILLSRGNLKTRSAAAGALIEFGGEIEFMEDIDSINMICRKSEVACGRRFLEPKTEM
jgi:hypothetical protein